MANRSRWPLILSLLFGWLCVADQGTSPTPPERPYEMVAANRTHDDHPSLLPLEDAEGWRVDVREAAGEVSSATDRALFGRGVLRLNYRAVSPGKAGLVRLFPPRPVPVTNAFDAVSLWIYGNNNFGKPTPSVHVQALFTVADGTRTTVTLATVRHKEWCVFKRCLRPEDRVRFRSGGTFDGLIIRGITDVATQALDFTSLCVFTESTQPLTFPPRPKRGVSIFPEKDDGINVGPGRLPFPTVSTTVIPVVPADDRLEFQLPEDGDFEKLAFRWQGGPWRRFAVAGGVWPQRASGVQVRFARVGNSVVADVTAPAGAVEEVRFGVVEDLPVVRRVPVPYYTYRDPELLSRPTILATRLAGSPFFIGATADWTQSNGSALFAETNATRCAANGGVRYLPKTDGRRNACFERLVWSFGTRFEDVLPVIPNPPSPWRQVTAGNVWRSTGARDRATDIAYFRGRHRWGLRHLVVTDHETMWRDGNESFTFRTQAAPKKGGDEGQRQFTRQMREELGFRYGPYNNFADLVPVNAYWHPDRLLLDPSGEWVSGWYRCYVPKPVYAPSACAEIAPQVQAKFGFNCVYCDVHTALTPWRRTDYDARVPGAGTFAQTFFAYGEVLLQQKQIFNGPVYSEGRSQWIFAGLADSNFAQDRVYRIDRNPWIVDFELRRVHPLCCDSGMGILDMFYGSSGDETRDRRAVDRWIAATLAFGHAPYLLGGMRNELRSYYMLQQIAAQYGAAAVRRIRYQDTTGALKEISEALLDDSYRLNRVLVEYDNGTVVAANGGSNGVMRVEIGGETRDLPPCGYAAASGDGKVFVLGGLLAGRRIDWCTSPEYVYMDGRTALTRFPDGGAADGVAIRRRVAAGEEEVLQYKSTRLELPYIAKSVEAMDWKGKSLGMRPVQVEKGCTVIVPDNAAFSWLVRF